MAPSIIARKQRPEKLDQVLVATGTRLENRHTRRGVRNEDIEQPIPLARYERRRLCSQIDGRRL